jgi:uncharacterized protein YegJ (DUF2314 family)
VIRFCFVIAISCLAAGCQPQKPDTLIESGYDESEMEAAIAKSRSSIDTFIQELQKPTGSDHAVKAPITDAGNTEHFWLTDVTYSNGEFEGIIGNEPGIVGNVKLGQKWKIKKSEVSDWMYFLNGKMRGNYTVRPLMKAMSPEDLEELNAMLDDTNL